MDIKKTFINLAYEAMLKALNVIVSRVVTGDVMRVVGGLMARDDLEGHQKREQAQTILAAMAKDVGGALAAVSSSMLNLVLEFAVAYLKNKQGA